MAEDSGAADKAYLDREKRKFDILQDLLKQVSKANEVALSKRVKFRKKWDDIAHSEPDPKLAQSFAQYAKAVERSDVAQHSCLQKLRDLSQKALRLYPERIKSHKRSISEHRKAKQTLDEHSLSLKKLQDQRDMRSVSQPAMHKVISQVEQSEKEVMGLKARLEGDMRKYREEQVEDLKRLLLHLLNAEMHYHATALDALSEVVPQLNSIDPAVSIRNRSFR